MSSTSASCNVGNFGEFPLSISADLAFMDSPAKRVEIDACQRTGSPVRHAHVLPTPWNLIDGSSASWSLPEDFVWYGSEGVLSQWLPFV